MIYSYHKHIDAVRTVELSAPEDTDGRLATELATIDGVTYVHVPDDRELPTQPKEISVAVVQQLTPELVKALKRDSPHVRLANARVVAQIRERYSVDDELGLLRRAVLGDIKDAEVADYLAYADACRARGRQEKAAFGL